MQRFHNRPTSLQAYGAAMLGRMATDLAFDGIEQANPRQDLGCQRRLVRYILVVEVAPHERPAECELYRPVGARSGQRLEAVIAVHLQHALEPGQVPSR